jgi:hypothetical protein
MRRGFGGADSSEAGPSPGTGHGDRLYVVRDAKEWEVETERTASGLNAGYYRKLLEKAWSEMAFVLC